MQKKIGVSGETTPSQCLYNFTQGYGRPEMKIRVYGKLPLMTTPPIEGQPFKCRTPMKYTEITEHPILFSSEMIRAILDGRKSQTRRIVKPQPEISELKTCDIKLLYWKGVNRGSCSGNGQDSMKDCCPHGIVGDRIWVRETFHINKPKHSGATGFVSYRADGEKSWKWTPSIHMPRWASRITLEIKSVRIERLQSITESDATSEGWNFNVNEDPVTWFRKLWDKINVKSGTRWDDNPWVYVIEFRNISARR